MNAAAALQPPDFARHWARELDCNEASLVRLQGGINNRVYRCGDDGQYQYVIKGYAPLEPGARDRMQAEVDFLKYANQVSPGFTPQLIKVDPNQRCIILEHLEGEAYPEGAPAPRAAVSHAVEFFRQLNADRSVAKHFIRLDAADGFFRLTEHLINIKYRLSGMSCSHLPDEVQPQAEILLAYMKNTCDEITEETNEKLLSGKVCDSINPIERCVSPSDFGFHNARWTKGRVVFFDFEFSGWDDPAKTIIDFILQPRVSVNQRMGDLINRFPVYCREKLSYRIEALMPILILKWMCIILAVLDPERLSEILAVSDEIDPKHLIQERVKIARSYSIRFKSLLPLSSLNQ